MRVIHSCPTCNGHGTVQKPSWIAGDQLTWESSGTAVYPCKSCNGTGLIWEEIENSTADERRSL